MFDNGKDLYFVCGEIIADCCFVYKTATTNTDVIDILSVVVSIVVVATITQTPRTTMEHDPCTFVCVCLLRLFST
jgi:hypothetical protein